MITPMQIKLARTALGLGVRELATIAEIAPSTIHRFETDKGSMHSRTLDRVQQVLEERGVIFISADENAGPGIRTRK
ncbi:transcriptional regulator [Caulobacter flavus]|uniref:Transcriptional regulator n=1 Tax=Caulobacter flavus TaxID=1679497 RepID=A0A2N5CZL0_9CAUL|nr:helix-turn-helix transcriptional regulator [Caulobacter flavus]AYV45088.1 transcriptional regulator [Caulobacter flavus]PLR19231.1 transcriptional regulator [Caulobacter flavus]